MVQRTGGLRRKTRSKFKKNVRMKGKISIRNYLQNFNENDKVALVMEPSIHSGIFHPRFQGDVGVIVGKQGTCYKIKIIDGKMQKYFIVHPVHLKKVKA